MKKKSRVVIENLFDDAQDSVSNASEPVVNASTPPPSAKRRKLEPQARLEQFNQLYQSVLPHLGKRPDSKLPMKHSTWINLVNLASTGEQLEKIAQLFPGWKDSGNQLNAAASESFVSESNVIK